MSEPIYSLRVARIAHETSEVATFELVPLPGCTLPPFTPGAHIDVHLGPGLVRQYSLCNAPTDACRYVIGVKKETSSRGGSKSMHEDVIEGGMLAISGPRNHFALADDAEEHLLLAGGIGITPLLCMARHLKATGARFRLVYFARSAELAAFHSDLSSPAWSSNVDFRYGIEPEHLTQTLRDLLDKRPSGRHLYVCGPRPFMDLVEKVALLAYPAGTVHAEYFAADESQLARPKNSFRVRCERSQQEFEVSQNDTIVSALRRHRVDIDVMCEEGVCGTCLTRVIAGTPDHRDAYLTEEEHERNDQMMVCCSRSRSDLLVLDL
jgi:vanillate monooxygenase ferredoxin subunit